MSAPHPTRTTATDLTEASQPVAEPRAPRLRLEPTGSTRTLLDGGWWPRSTDPLAELPGLVLAIDPLHGPVARLVLSADGWDSHPRQLTVAGRVVRLGWFVSQPASLLTAICRSADRLDLLVVPPDSSRELAEGAMARAATAANRVHAPQLLSAALPTPRPRPRPQTAAGDLRNCLMREQPMKIARHRIIEVLRARGQHVRADWIRRELPDEVDVVQHAGLLATLHVDPAELAETPSP